MAETAEAVLSDNLSTGTNIDVDLQLNIISNDKPVSSLLHRLIGLDLLDVETDCRFEPLGVRTLKQFLSS